MRLTSRLKSKTKKNSSGSEATSKKPLEADVSALDGVSQEGSIEGLTDLYFPEETEKSSVHDIIDILLETEKITPTQHASLKREQTQNPTSDVATLLRKTKISEDEILEAKSRLYGFEFGHIQPADIEREAFEKLDIDFIKDYSVCPIRIEEDTLVVATSDPTNVFIPEQIRKHTQMNLRIIACPQKDMRNCTRIIQTRRKI